MNDETAAPAGAAAGRLWGLRLRRGVVSKPQGVRGTEVFWDRMSILFTHGIGLLS